MFRVMLSASADLDEVKRFRYPLVASPKVGGVRAFVVKGVLYNRNSRAFSNNHAQALFGRPEFNGIDGELAVGSVTAPDMYETTWEAAMTRTGEPKFTFWAYDHFLVPYKPYQERHDTLRELLNKVGKANHEIRQVPTKTVMSFAELEEYEANYLLGGFDGVVLHDPAGSYLSGQSAASEQLFVEFCRHAASEAVIIEAAPALHAATRAPLDNLGSLHVKDAKTGVHLHIARGFTPEQRAAIWHDHKRGELAGQIIKYKQQDTGVKSTPQAPVFEGFRNGR